MSACVLSDYITAKGLKLTVGEESAAASLILPKIISPVKTGAVIT